MENKTSNQLALRKHSITILGLLAKTQANTQEDRDVAMMELRLVENELTVSEALRGDHIATITAQHPEGRAGVATLLFNLLKVNRDMLKMNNSMSDMDARLIGADLVTKYRHETIEDFILCFKNGREGKYGKTYNRFDSEVVFSWMEFYFEEKAFEREAAQRQRFIQTDSTQVTNPQYLEVLKTVQKGIEDRKHNEAIQRDQNIQKAFDMTMYCHNLRNDVPKWRDKDLEHAAFELGTRTGRDWSEAISIVNQEINKRKTPTQ